MYESDKLSKCVERARKRYFKTEFTHFGSVNFTQDMNSGEMRTLWQKVCRKLTEAKAVALWVVEVSRDTNHFNYHLLFRSHTPNASDIIKKACKDVSINIKFERYDPKRGRFTVRYMAKAKTPQVRDGEVVCRDKYASKRVLLRQDLKMHKYGTIGRFWPEGKNKEALWTEIKDREKRIAAGLKCPAVEQCAFDLWQMVQTDYTLDQVRRSIGYHGIPDGWRRRSGCQRTRQPMQGMPQMRSPFLVETVTSLVTTRLRQ